MTVSVVDQACEEKSDTSKEQHGELTAQGLQFHKEIDSK